MQVLFSSEMINETLVWAGIVVFCRWHHTTGGVYFGPTRKCMGKLPVQICTHWYPLVRPISLVALGLDST